MKMLDDSKKNEFVSLLPSNKRSGVCNKILEQIRAGESYAPTIADKVFDKLNKYPVDNQAITSVLMDNPFLFMDAIVYYIEYEKLSYDDKQELKRSNSKPFIEQYMDGQPITENQIRKLNQLNYMGNLDLTKLGASQKIDELINE